MRALANVANESYPTSFTQGVTLTVTGIADLRAITYGL